MKRLLFLAVLALISCSDEKSGVNTANIMGSWQISGKKINGAFTDYPNSCDTNSDVYVLGPDGTFSTTLYSAGCEPFTSDAGHWSRTGKQIQILDPDPAAYLDGTFTVDNYNANELWLRQEVESPEGTTVVFYFLERVN